jgi:ribonuclease VapC
MIVDTSAVLAILFAEPEAQRIADAIENNPDCRFPATCYLEAVITLLGRNGEEGLRDLDLAMAQSRMEIAPFTESQARLAREAFKRYGKGRHPAQFNFGDCMAYAPAKETGEELLFKGTDFGQTDIAIAAY